MAEQEAKFGKWNLKDVEKIKRDYKVPNFGVDSDILGVQSALASSEATLGLTWTPT